MIIKPFGDKILVKPIEREKSSIPGFVMKEEYNMGTVVSVGPGKKIKDGKYEPVHVKIGDRIRFGTMGKDEYLKFQPVMHNDEKHLLMSWQDVCFIEEE
ncbi:GroS Co-chaperonin GroES (HSP10) [uncultured Caudovirales phage]|uniref:GroS Co-chaperonin GroES (HSP10) n=1 Tax=uncultured Caudovirales phage TaxID=2100421 RepID=A0A6J5L7V2_9CAUD|nr:GroS Co-chaperonin GroES (HSP10) [uncultured Caudovirales phage]